MCQIAYRRSFQNIWECKGPQWQDWKHRQGREVKRKKQYSGLKHFLTFCFKRKKNKNFSQFRSSDETRILGKGFNIKFGTIMFQIGKFLCIYSTYSILPNLNVKILLYQRFFHWMFPLCHIKTQCRGCLALCTSGMTVRPHIISPLCPQDLGMTDWPHIFPP